MLAINVYICGMNDKFSWVFHKSKQTKMKILLFNCLLFCLIHLAKSQDGFFTDEDFANAENVDINEQPPEFIEESSIQNEIPKWV